MRSQIFIKRKMSAKDITDPLHTPTGYFMVLRRDSSSRAVAEAAWGSEDTHVQSTATCRPRLQPVGARGAPHLPFGFALKPCPSAPWAPGLLSAFWEWGSPDLPACSPRHGSARGPVRPIFISKRPRPSRGPSLARRTTQDLLGSGLTRLARVGRRDQGNANLARFQ